MTKGTPDTQRSEQEKNAQSNARGVYVMTPDPVHAQLEAFLAWSRADIARMAQRRGLGGVTGLAGGVQAVQTELLSAN